MGESVSSAVMRALLVLLLVPAVLGTEIPLDMAAAAHPAVHSAVTMGGNVPIATSPGVGAPLYNGVGACPSGIGCGGYTGWQSPLKTGYHSFNVDVTNVPKPSKELDVFHV